MPDFQVDYAEVESTASAIRTGRQDIEGVLTDLKGQVDELLGEGFSTESASVVFGEGYEELTSGLNTAIEGLDEMAEKLDQFVADTKDFDSSRS